MAETSTIIALEESLTFNVGSATILGDLTIPEGARGVVLFAHGSGNCRHSPRNRFVAGERNQASLTTLLIDLLTPIEEQVDEETGQLRFDIGHFFQ